MKKQQYISECVSTIEQAQEGYSIGERKERLIVYYRAQPRQLSLIF